MKKPKFFGTVPNGIRLGRLEIYYQKGVFFKPSMFKSDCGCRFLDLTIIGFTWLSEDYCISGYTNSFEIDTST